MNIRKIVDLNADRAPQSDCTDADAEAYCYTYRDYDILEVTRIWAEGGVVDPASLNTRSASFQGEWVSEIEHECLPDFSCCHPALRASAQERADYYAKYVEHVNSDTPDDQPFDCELSTTFLHKLLEHEGLADEVTIVAGLDPRNLH